MSNSLTLQNLSKNIERHNRQTELLNAIEITKKDKKRQKFFLDLYEKEFQLHENK